MDRYKIIISRRALAELQSIHAFIKQDSPQNASLMIQRILDALEALRQFPHQIKPYSERVNAGQTVRILSVAPYLIYLRIVDKNQTVRVLHVRHGARRPPKRL